MYKAQGTEYIKNIINGKSVFVYGDPDIDGIVATYFVLQYLKANNIPYTYFFNNDRQHGFKITDNVIDVLHGAVIVAVDFHMTFAEIRYLVDNGVSIVNIDHHEIEDDFVYYINENTNAQGVILCNQYKTESDAWRFLSGAGVVYNTLCNIYPVFDTQEHRALVGLTLLSDECPLENQQAQQYLQELYSWQSEKTQYLINIVQNAKQRKGTFGVQKYLDREFITYSFNPVFNALCRYNKTYLALDVLMGNVTNNVDLYTYKLQQTAIRDYLLNNCTVVDYDSFCTCFINTKNLEVSEVNYANFLGLVANNLLNEYNKTIMIWLCDNDVFVRGSVRGINPMVDYLQICKACGIACDGHQGAFGLLEVPTQEQIKVLAQQIALQESTVKAQGLTTYKIINVCNLQQMLTFDKETAVYNAFVRNIYRAYYKYTGNNWQEIKRSTHAEYVVYSIDGITVKCFDTTLTPENAYILPLVTNGYVQCTLCNIKIY